MRLNLWPRNVVHRHEPPVTARPVKIIHHDAEREFVAIDKPGSIVGRSSVVQPAPNLVPQPVHAAGRYFRHTLVEILKNEFGYEKIYSGFNRLVVPLALNAFSLPAVNRLDRLTSGLMILGLSNKTASELSAEFRGGNIKKEYIARCKGEFPACVLPCLRTLLTCR